MVSFWSMFLSMLSWTFSPSKMTSMASLDGRDPTLDSTACPHSWDSRTFATSENHTYVVDIFPVIRPLFLSVLPSSSFSFFHFSLGVCSCLFVCFYFTSFYFTVLFNVSSNPVLPQWHVKDPDHSAKKCRWQVTPKHACTFDPTKSEWVDLAAVKA